MFSALSYSVRSSTCPTQFSGYNQGMVPQYQDNIRKLKAFFTPQTSEERSRIHSARPFFVVIILTVSGLWGYFVFSYPPLRTPLNFLLFTGLIVLHNLLHWFTPILIYRPRTSLIYMLCQSMLAFGIILFLKDSTTIVVLYSILFLQSLGVIKEGWQRFAGGLFQLTLLIANILIFSGWHNMTSWLWLILLVLGISLPYVISFGQQDAARQQAQSLLRELEATHQKLADYTLQVEELTRSRERERIARELHDTLSQGLAGLILQLEAATSHLEEDNPKQSFTILKHALSDARQALSEARQTITTLRQSDTFPGDLQAQVLTEINRFSNVSGIPCTLDIGSVSQLSETFHQHILRILTESLSNIAQHAQAKSVIITAHCAADHFTLTIQDDGVGFVTESVPSGHYGLLGIKERARLIGATLAIQSVPEQGTTIQLTIPLDEGTGS
jgi:NarL family two-component system sensor histidine kinase YdfH